MKLTLDWTVELDVEHDLEVRVRVTPGREPPPCSNPDSPRFSDDGCPAEVEDVRIVDAEPPLKVGQKIDLEHHLASDEAFREAALMAMDEEIQGQRDAADEARYEFDCERRWKP